MDDDVFAFDTNNANSGVSQKDPANFKTNILSSGDYVEYDYMACNFDNNYVIIGYVAL